MGQSCLVPKRGMPAEGRGKTVGKGKREEERLEKRRKQTELIPRAETH